MTTTLGGSTAAPAAATRCPGCAAPTQASQRFCVECGRALRPRYGRAPDWRGALAAAALAVIAAGVGAGFALGALTATKHKTPPPRTVTTGTAPTTPAVTPPAAPVTKTPTTPPAHRLVPHARATRHARTTRPSLPRTTPRRAVGRGQVAPTRSK